MSSILVQPQNVNSNYGMVESFSIVIDSFDSIQWQIKQDNYSTWNDIQDAIQTEYKFIVNSYVAKYRCKIYSVETTLYSNEVQVIQIPQSGRTGFDFGYYWEEVYATGMTQDMKTYNATKFMKQLVTLWGWSKEFASAVCGNCWLECNMSPGTWESFDNKSRGYSWVQWTPSTVLTDWCEQTYPLTQWRNNGQMALNRLKYEADNNIMYYWQNMIHRHGDVSEMADDFCLNYLRPTPEQYEESIEARKARAVWVYNNIRVVPHGMFIWILKKMTPEGRKNK